MNKSRNSTRTHQYNACTLYKTFAHDNFLNKSSNQRNKKLSAVF